MTGASETDCLEVTGVSQLRKLESFEGVGSGNTRLAPQVVVLKTKAFMSKVASFINPRLTEGWGTTFSASRIWTERLVTWIVRPATGQA